MFSARRDARPAAILADIDDALKQRGLLSLCTALCLKLTEEDVVVSSAGHPMPLIAAADGRVRVVGSPGILLGTLEQRSWREERLALEPGETLLIYTDGVTDTRGSTSASARRGCVSS
jgi:serine phosphatase RsbU (regulator of sigma subunit)